MSQQPAPPAKPTETAVARYAPEVVTATVNAWIPREVTLVDAARTRAQSAYAIASTLAGVLVGAGLLTTLDTRPTLVKIVGVVALAGWLVAAALYLRAVASPISAPPRESEAVDANSFVDTIIDDATRDRAAIDGRLKVANGASMVALIVTLVMTALALFVTKSDDTKAVQLALTDDGAKAVAKICPKMPSTFLGDADNSTLGTDTVKVKVAAGVCDDIEVTLRIPKGSIAVVRSAP